MQRSNYIIKVTRTGDLFISNGRAIKECADDRQCFLINDVMLIFLGHRVHFWGHIGWLVFPSAEMFIWTRLLVCRICFGAAKWCRANFRERLFGLEAKAEIQDISVRLNRQQHSFFFLYNKIYLVTTLLMTILTFTWRKNKNNVQEIKEKYNVTAFTAN